MKQLMRNLRVVLIFFLVLAVALLSGLVVQQQRSQHTLLIAAGENKAALRARYARAGQILSADGVILAQSRDGVRDYAQDQALARAGLQLIGDYTHNMTNTLEAKYQSALLGMDRNFFSQLLLDVTGRGLQGNQLTLTLDSRMMKQALSRLGRNSGAAVILNYRTGEVIAAVSTPTTDPAAVVNWETRKIPETALFNKALSGQYLPGSIFKIVTAAAWLGDPSYDAAHTVDCLGQKPGIGSGGVTEANKPHGTLDLSQAFAVSCNHYFGQVGVSLGAARLQQVAEEFGFNQTAGLGQLSTTQPRFQVPQQDAILLSWQSIGQPAGESVLLTSPLHLASLAGSIANGGKMMQPVLIREQVNPLGHSRTFTPAQLRQTVSPDLAKQLETLMIGVVKSGTGKAAAVRGQTVAGKTGTSQQRTADGKLTTNSLFAGYLLSEDKPYAVAVVLENTTNSAAQIAGRLLADLSAGK